MATASSRRTKEPPQVVVKRSQLEKSQVQKDRQQLENSTSLRDFCGRFLARRSPERVFAMERKFTFSLMASFSILLGILALFAVLPENGAPLPHLKNPEMSRDTIIADSWVRVASSKPHSSVSQFLSHTAARGPVPLWEDRAIPSPNIKHCQTCSLPPKQWVLNPPVQCSLQLIVFLSHHSR